MLHRLDQISTHNLGVLQQVFVQLDYLEASAYYQIAKERLRIIRKLTGLADENAKERAMQEHPGARWFRSVWKAPAATAPAWPVI